jgi:hypothetical protein
MNRIYLLKMRVWAFLIEVPLMALLMICWNVNDQVDELLKLYPLIIALAAGIIFLAVYLFRLVEVSWEEIRDIGLFTRRDSGLISKGRVLELRLKAHGLVGITLMGHDGEYAGFDWMRPDEGAPSDIALYRGNAYGGKGAIGKLLRYFGADDAEVAGLIAMDIIKADFEYASATACRENDSLLIKISINETLMANGTPVPEVDQGE